VRTVPYAYVPNAYDPKAYDPNAYGPATYGPVTHRLARTFGHRTDSIRSDRAFGGRTPRKGTTVVMMLASHSGTAAERGHRTETSNPLTDVDRYRHS